MPRPSFIQGVTSALILASCAAAPPEPVAGSATLGAKYVAMGSSFAAGPGVTTSADTPGTRCNRSADNYPHQLARRQNLNLVDVSCSGARTDHILGRWNELPPQIEAVDAQTRLVTITIGGNDVGYIGGLMQASCQNETCETRPPPSEQTYAELERRMDEVAREVRRRAPSAQIIFVDYPAVLPPEGVCVATPLSEAAADNGRAIARRLANITARAAEQNGADILAASSLSEAHDACAATPWMNGSPSPGHPVQGAAYHPNLAGMTAVANALSEMLH